MKRWLPIFMAMCAVMRAESDFEAGNRAYDEGRFLEARQHYEAQVARGEWTANLFYNLGNANERIGAPGLAMLNYERALILSRYDWQSFLRRPSFWRLLLLAGENHPEARANLQYLRDRSLARVERTTGVEAVIGLFDFDGWVAIACASGWAALFCVLSPYVRRRSLSSGAVFSSVLLALLAISAVATASLTAAELDAGVIIAKQAEARQAPTERASLADVLPAGSRVRVLAVRGEWTFCELPGGARAWVASAAVERVRLS